MTISKKIVLFIILIILVILATFTMIFINRMDDINKLENIFIEKNIKKFQNIIELTNNNIKNISYEYSVNEELLKLIKSKDKNKLLDFMDKRDNLMQKLKLSYFILYDKNKKLIYENAYDINSNEYLSSPEELNTFLASTHEKYISNKNKIFYMTLNYEKTIFIYKKLISNNEHIGYIFLARTLDAQMLEDIGELLQEYISLISSYDDFKIKELSYFGKKIYYNIEKISKYKVFSYIKLYDELKDENFYIRMSSKRQIFDFLLKNIEITIVLFLSILMLVLVTFYMFIQKLFTTRIQYITKMVKIASKNESLRLELKLEYNDEITYLSEKMNEMFVHVNYAQSLKLEKERDFLQSVLDSQENIILITDGNTIHSTNKKFKDIFSSKEHFFTNIALLDKNTSSNLLKVAKKYDSIDKPARLMCLNENNKYFTFDVRKLDLEKYLICMNDVSTYKQTIIELKNRASIDDLTQIYNKQSITSFLKIWLKEKDFCLILFDIDHFKKVNDNYGHHAGDFILKELSSVISLNLRKNDVFGRFGGEEFLILLDLDNKKDINKICQNIRLCVEEKVFNYDKINIKITISLGATFCIFNENYDEVYKRCDKALYKAKETGRNKVMISN